MSIVQSRDFEVALSVPSTRRLELAAYPRTCQPVTGDEDLRDIEQNLSSTRQERNVAEDFTGRFWFADAPDTAVPGRLTWNDRWPRVELLGALSPAMDKHPTESGHYIDAQPKPPRTIHGSTLGTPSKVTLFNAVVSNHTTNMLTFNPLEPDNAVQIQTFRGTCAVVGAHVGDLTATFPALRYRIQRQDAWATFSGLSGQIQQNPHTVTYQYREPDSVTAPLVGTTGTVALEASATISPLRLAGAYFLTKTMFRVTPDEPVTIVDEWQRYVTGTSVLMTLLSNTDCPPVFFEVYVEYLQRWCEVRMPGLAGDLSDVRETKIPEAPLMSRQQLGLDYVAAWIDLVGRLSPLPHIVAGTIGSDDRTVQNRLLELATCAEGLHRRLYPDGRRLSPEQVEAAKSAIADAPVDEEIKKILGDAIGTYLWEPSFPQRIARLAEDTAAAMPGVTGKPSKWKSAVVNARNGFAHQLAGTESDADKLFALHTLAGSLRWLLTGRLLREIGLHNADIASAVGAYRPYEQFLQSAKHDLAAVYACITVAIFRCVTALPLSVMSR